MRASKKAGDPDNFTAYVHRIMESLWLLAVIASALAVSPADWMLSYIQMPKVVLLRILVSLMVILWVLEWAISSKSSVLPRPIFDLDYPEAVGISRADALADNCRWRPFWLRMSYPLCCPRHSESACGAGRLEKTVIAYITC